MRPYRYPKKLRPDVDFTTLRRNLSYITTQIFLRRHVISRTTGNERCIETICWKIRNKAQIIWCYRRKTITLPPIEFIKQYNL